MICKLPHVHCNIINKSVISYKEVGTMLDLTLYCIDSSDLSLRL